MTLNATLNPLQHQATFALRARGLAARQGSQSFAKADKAMHLGYSIYQLTSTIVFHTA